MVGDTIKKCKNDNYLEFLKNIPHVYSECLVAGPVIDDMITFLSNRPELAKTEYTQYVFEFSCSCVGHVCPLLPSVRVASPIRGFGGVDLSAVIESLQGYLW